MTAVTCYTNTSAQQRNFEILNLKVLNLTRCLFSLSDHFVSVFICFSFNEFLTISPAIVNNSPFALVTPFTSSRHLVSTRCTLFTTRTSTVEIINRGTSLKNTIITPAASTTPAVSTSPAASTTYFTRVNALLTLGIIWSHILCH